MTTDTIMMGKLRPYWGRVMLIESHVTEETRTSGIVVPVTDSDSTLQRGVVQHVDMVWHEDAPTRGLAELLLPGTVVYYRNGWKIGDVIFVDTDDIVAFEADQ